MVCLVSKATALAFVPAVAAHGFMTHPVAIIPNAPGYDLPTGLFAKGREVRLTDYTRIPGKKGSCPGQPPEDPTGKTPYDGPQACPFTAPGTAFVDSPCGMTCGGGHGTNAQDCGDSGKEHIPFDKKRFDGYCDARNYLSKFGGSPPVTKWQAGSVQEVAWSANAMHSGGSAYRLCSLDKVGKDTGNKGSTEECFQQGHLQFATEETCTRHSSTPSSKDSCWPAETQVDSRGNQWRVVKQKCGLNCQFSFVDKVRIPASLPLGRYALSWRWDCGNVPQVFLSCAEVEIVSHLTNSSLV